MMKDRIARTVCLFLLVAVSLVGCERGKKVPAPARAEKADAEREFEARIAGLIQEGTDVNTVRDRDIPILYWAVGHNFVDAVATLLESGADPNTRPKPRATDTVIYETINSRSWKDSYERQAVDKSRLIAELLLKHGAKLSTTSKMNNTVLHQAALRGRTDLCDLFIQYGAKINDADALGNTPLHRAAKSGYWEATQFLLRKGAQPNPENKFGKTPLALAKERGDEELNQQIREGARKDYNPGSDYDQTIEVLTQHGAQ